MTRKPPQGQDFSTISVPMTSGRRHRPVSIRRFITRRLPQTTVPHTLMSQTKSWMRYSHICSLWDLFHATGKPGSSALPIKPAPSRKAAISPLHWPGGTGSIIQSDIISHKNSRRHFRRALFLCGNLFYGNTLQITLYIFSSLSQQPYPDARYHLHTPG